MAHKIVVTGVNGRMGGTIAGLVREDSSMELAGIVERTDRLHGLEKFNCPFSDNLDKILSRTGRCIVIDFTSPEAGMEAAEICAVHACAAVMGTTGFSPGQLGRLEEIASETPLFWAPNMSVGINVLLRVLPDLVKLLGENYDLEIMEIHHRFKKDAPSGTALKLAQVLAQVRGLDLEHDGVFARKGMIGQRSDREIGVQTLRGGDVVGDHTIYFFGPGERIEVTHRAHSRETFARGAVRAAKWMAGRKPGKLYTMADMLS